MELLITHFVTLPDIKFIAMDGDPVVLQLSFHLGWLKYQARSTHEAVPTRFNNNSHPFLIESMLILFVQVVDYLTWCQFMSQLLKIWLSYC